MPSKTILIVDDELSILVPLQFLMEKEGYVVKLAQSGKEAIEKIHEIQPDLILLDIMLPDLDGYEIYQMIRNRREWESIRVIFLRPKTGMPISPKAWPWERMLTSPSLFPIPN